MALRTASYCCKPDAASVIGDEAAQEAVMRFVIDKLFDRNLNLGGGIFVNRFTKPGKGQFYACVYEEAGLDHLVFLTRKDVADVPGLLAILDDVDKDATRNRIWDID